MRAVLFAALLVAAVLAGCSSQPATTSTSTSAPPPLPEPGTTPIAFHADGAVVPTGSFGGLPEVVQRFVANRTSGEPTVGWNAHGAIIYPSIAFDALPDAAAQVAGQLPRTFVYVSTDNGTTWSDRTPSYANAGALASEPVSMDPFVYVDPHTGRMFTTDLYIGCAYTSYSDDDGATWLTNPFTCGVPVDDHQSIAAGPFVVPPVSTPVYPDVLYYCINQIGATTCSHSLDGGLTWVAGEPAYPGAQAGGEGQSADVCGGLSGHVFASWKTGTVFVPKGQCGVAMVARSTTNGATWTDVTVDHSVGFDGHDGAVAVDANGTVYYLFLDAHTLPRLSVSHDDGATWSHPLNVTTPGVTTCKYPAITAGDAGRIAFLCIGSTTPHGPRYDAGCKDAPKCLDGDKYPSELHNATWNVYVTYSFDADRENATFLTVMANPPADPIARGYCSDRCYKLDNDGMFDFADIQHNPVTGQVVASFVDQCVEACAQPNGTDQDISHGRGAVAVQVGGPSLFAAKTS